MPRACTEPAFLNCSSYNPNWVLNYQYADNATPLLPKGTMLHVISWFDTTAKNSRVVDYRNWTGWGHRTVDNMIINLAQMEFLTDEQFAQEVAKRKEKVQAGQASLLGCLSCLAEPPSANASRARVAER